MEVLSKKRFSNLPWWIKLKLSAPVYNRLEGTSEVQCGIFTWVVWSGGKVTQKVSILSSSTRV